MKFKIYKPLLIFVFSLFLFGSAFSQTERDKGIESYKRGNLPEAIGNLKKWTKDNSSDAQGWLYLGLSYLKKDDAKNAIKALKKAVEISPQDGTARVGLAYAYLLKNNLEDAQIEARKSLELNSKNAEAHYIVGVVNLRNASYNAAYERAAKAIELNPNFTAAYLLKAESLISSFVQQTGTVIKPANARGEMLREAAEDLKKYVSSQNGKEAKFYQDYVESVRFFAEYYDRPENQTSKISEPEAKPNNNETALKIISKQPPSYTDTARQSGVQGVVRLMVGFSSDGSVKHIMVVKPLSHGLNEEAVRAARLIKFEPATRDGKPISVVKQIEYSFSIY